MPIVSRLTPLIIFLTALLARLAALGRYVTPDEPSWVFRSVRFREALLAADWAGTLQSGHPGVTTTWLGSLAIQLQLWLQPASKIHLNWINKLFWLSPGNGEAIQHLDHFLDPARLLVILVTSLGVLAIFLLARDRFGLMAAIIGAFLLALDPFLAGLSGLLHLDALLATFMVLTVLLLMPRRDPERDPKSRNGLPVSRRYWILAGVTTALAILTKTPGLFLLLVVPAIWLWQWFKVEKDVEPWYLAIGLWAISTIVISLLLLPAIWADPGNTLVTIRGLTGRLLVDAVRPTFFLGELTLQPGSTFYPLAILYRLAPLTSLGLLAAIIGLFYGSFKKHVLSIPASVWWLFLFGLVFVIFLNFSAKRFDRYALPAIYAFILVSGWGLSTLTFYIWNLGRRRLSALLLLFFLFMAVTYLVNSWPYPLTAYNWILGGPATAQKVLPVDWGEGSSTAARWADNIPGSEQQTLFSANLPAAASFFPGKNLLLSQENLARAEPGDLAIYDASFWQSDPTNFSFDGIQSTPIPKSLVGWTVLESFHFTGLPRSVLLSAGDLKTRTIEPVSEAAIGMSFNNDVQILSATVFSTSSPFWIQVISEWQLSQAENYQVVLELRDESDHVRSRFELPLLNEVDHRAGSWPPGEIQTVYHDVPLPADLPPGAYTITVTLFDQEGARLGVFDDTGHFRGATIKVANFEINAPESQPPISIPIPLDSSSELAGYGELPESAGVGEPLTLDLWWHGNERGFSGAQLALLIDDIVVLSDSELSIGKPGQIYHIRPSWRIPDDLPPGSHSLAIQLFNDKGKPAWVKPIALGPLEFEQRHRIFDLPSGLDPLQIQIGQIAHLQQALTTLQDNQIAVNLIWQANMPDGQNYVTFVHLMDADGNIVSQVDRPPVEPTELWLSDQVVNDLYILPTPEAGLYKIAIGLYEAASGRRLPVIQEEADPSATDSYQIELKIP